MENIMHHLFLPVIILEWFAFLSFYYEAKKKYHLELYLTISHTAVQFFLNGQCVHFLLPILD